MQLSNNHGDAVVALGDGGGTMAFGAACWAAIEGSNFFPTYKYRLFVVRQCRKIMTQKCANTQETCRKNWPVGAKIGDIVTCR